MPTPRKEQVSKHTNGHYHCISRAVRRAFLCGVDRQSGCNYEHRRQWILDRLEVLTKITRKNYKTAIVRQAKLVISYRVKVSVWCNQVIDYKKV
ncbi:hypothetical protein QUF61_15895 [Candidatus Venteria ishoeyi]|uniref:hypothetical protein n=1 Tax=Candidatus Venteria ishoeyi TaxID=1899563 RepID=UPI0025A637AC|nr:hypothetical protein [Candidatus Venteria ishoeyi]MDM8547971.1 hypothetical protein [Candidatus Venteria ishoeyi]